MPTRGSMLLAGDTGGTSTRLALVEVVGGDLRIAAAARYPSRGHPSLAAIVEAFRAHHSEAIGGACFGVAGPVIRGRAETPNLPWVVDAAVLSRVVGLGHVDVINLLEANAHGIFAQEPGDFAVLNPMPRGAGSTARPRPRSCSPTTRPTSPGSSAGQTRPPGSRTRSTRR